MKRAVVFALLCASAYAQTSHEAALRNLRFRSIGPAIMGGRVDDIAVQESDSRIMYIGLASGGIMKTVNGGVTWTPIFDETGSPSIGDIAIAPSNPAILYVGTGEPNNRQSSSWGNGVYKSLDAGKTWQNVGLKDTKQIGRVIVHPTDPNIVYVAALGDLWGASAERGVFKTADGGATWSKIFFIDEDTGISDLAIDPQSPNILYASAYQRRRTVYGYNGGGPKSGVFRSYDAGAKWSKVTAGLPTQGDIGRCTVEIYKKNPNVVYILFEHLTGGGIYRSDNRGETFVKMSDTNPRPSYYSQVRVDPNNENKVWVLGAPLYLSQDGGRTFTQMDRGIHSDFHGFWVDPANGDHVVAGSDGGVTISWDSARSWDFVNNMAIGQFYEVHYDFQQPYRLCGGLQDNNTWCGPSSTRTARGVTNNDWINISGGDGFHARIDPKDPDTVYAESQDGNLSRRQLSTGVTKSIRPVEDSVKGPRYRFQWNSPLIISPHDNKTIYYGGNYLFKSTDRGDNWERLGDKDLTNNGDRNTLPILGKVVGRDTLSRNDGVVAWPAVTAIAESPVKPGILWAGTDDGNLQVSRDGGKTWTNAADKITGVKDIKKYAYVSRIEASYKEEGTAYVSFDGHRMADYSVYIFMTRDYGQTWTKITEGIPADAGTVHVVREDPVNPNLLFAGTEFGLFVSFNRGQRWERMKNGLPPVPVFDLQIHPREHDLILATHGRSLWIMDNITPLEQMDDAVLTTDVKFFQPLNGTQWRTANYTSTYIGSREYFGQQPANTGLVLDYWAKIAGPVTITVKNSAGATVRTLNARSTANTVNRTQWDMRHDNPLAGLMGGGRGGAGGGGGAGAAAAGGRGAAGGAAGGRGAAGAGGRGAAGGGAGGRGAGGGAAPAAGGETAASETASASESEAGEGRGAGAFAGFGGGGGGGGRGGGGAMSVEPGEYTITLALAGKTETRTVKVDEDPRLTFTAADRAKRKALVDRAVSLAKDADTGRRKIVALRTALTALIDGWKRPGAPPVSDAIKKYADDLAAKAKAAAIPAFDAEPSDEPRLLGFAGAPLRYVEPTVSTQITRVLQTVMNYPAAPTAKQMADLDQAEANLKAALAEVGKLDGEVPKLNKMMADAGVPYFTVDTTNVPAATGGRGGGEN